MQRYTVHRLVHIQCCRTDDSLSQNIHHLIGNIAERKHNILKKWSKWTYIQKLSLKVLNDVKQIICEIKIIAVYSVVYMQSTSLSRIVQPHLPHFLHRELLIVKERKVTASFYNCRYLMCWCRHLQELRKLQFKNSLHNTQLRSAVCLLNSC